MLLYIGTHETNYTYILRSTLLPCIYVTNAIWYGKSVPNTTKKHTWVPWTAH